MVTKVDGHSRWIKVNTKRAKRTPGKSKKRVWVDRHNRKKPKRRR